MRNKVRFHPQSNVGLGRGVGDQICSKPTLGWGLSACFSDAKGKSEINADV